MADYGKGFMYRNQIAYRRVRDEHEPLQRNVSSFLNPPRIRAADRKRKCIHIMMGLVLLSGCALKALSCLCRRRADFRPCLLCDFRQNQSGNRRPGRVVGHDSLLYCPSNIKHSITNVGKTNAKVLRWAPATKRQDGRSGVDYWKPNGPPHENLK